MPIEWDKIESKPVEKYKIAGVDILNLKNKIEHQEKSIEEVTSKVNASEKKVSELMAENKKKDEKINSLEAEIKGQNEKITSLGAELAEKNGNISALETNISELNNSISAKEAESTQLSEDISSKNTRTAELQNQITKLQNQIAESQKKSSQLQEQAKGKESELKTQFEEIQGILKDREDALKEREEDIDKLNATNAGLEAKITELKELIPKKPVYEKADETVKSKSGCPKCGWPVLEDYKIVDGKKKLIRKYCPNTFCMWTSAEGPKVNIVMTSEAPVEEENVVKIFRVKGSDIEAAESLNSTMVAIIADPAQNIIWVWKGKDSSRFEYAEATGLVNKVKKVVTKMHSARIERVNEESEPETFPKF